MTARFLSLACGVADAVLAAHAPASAQGRPSHDTYSVAAHLTDQAPRIDGILDEKIWETAVMIDAFTQQEPRIGEPATERTEVRVLYDSRHLYIGVHAFDSNPAGIIATEMRRDSERLFDEDSFQVILDTFNDSRHGYMFVTSPLGAKLEEQISEEGEGSIRGGNSN